jgi:hypothetical protein
MGQQASKAAKNVSTRLSAVSKQISKPTSRFTDPSATEAGFTRGEGPVRSDGGVYIDPRDEKQRQFLAKQAGGSDKYKEMPDDLVKFLVDVGPVGKKKEDKKENINNKLHAMQVKSSPAASSTKDNARVNPRQPNSIPIDQETGKAVESSPRVREEMPLAKNIGGFNTTRTTSFSYKQESENDRDFGVGDVLDIYDLVVRKHTLSSIDEAVESFYQDRIKDRDVKWTDEEQKGHRELLQQALKYVEIPIIMKDTDDSYVGAWPERVEELKHLKIVEMPKTKVKLVMEDLLQDKKEEQKLVA